jgi:hypothetical protein
VSLNRVAIPSPNYSSRAGAAVRLIVIHTAEGATTYQSLGSYFANPASQVSSHAGIDDTPGTIGVYVQRGDKAWTAADANPCAIQAELTGFAAWGPDDWAAHPTMLDNCAQWVAEEAAAFGIPITKLTPDQAQGGASGVCQHADLGSWGGGHWDCGSSFPIDSVLAAARGETPAPPEPPAPAPPKPTAGPPFPYGPDDYLGQPSADPHCHSGYYGGVDQQNVQTWQAQMVARGWTLSVDGMYGPDSETACVQFQREKGLGVDGLVGPDTWAATWNAPVT